MADIIGRKDDQGNLITEISVRLTEDPTARPHDEPGIQGASGHANMSGAPVYVDGPSGRILLTRSNPGDPYTAVQSGYTPGIYILTATSYNGQVNRITVAAPGMHAITSPLSNEHVPGNSPLKVTWSYEFAAQEVTIETHDFTSPGAKADNGKFTIPPRGNPARDDQCVRVWRINRAEVVRGQMHATFTAQVLDEVVPIIAE